MRKTDDLYTCACCGYKTLGEQPPGTFEICHVCGWEDDNVQFHDPDFQGGANGISLRQAQYDFRDLDDVIEDSVLDPTWAILAPPVPQFNELVKPGFIVDRLGNVTIVKGGSQQ